MRLAPTDEKTLDQYLSYAIDEGDIGAARESARRFVALNPWSSAGRERMAYISIQRQDSNALVQSREALRLDPISLPEC